MGKSFMDKEGGRGRNKNIGGTNVRCTVKENHKIMEQWPLPLTVFFSVIKQSVGERQLFHSIVNAV